jgi:protein TonB
MLEDSLFESQGDRKTRKPFTLAIAVIAHAVTIGALVLIPLLQTQALTLAPVNLSLLAPRLPISRSVDIFSTPRPVQKYSAPASDALTAPTWIPPRVVITDDGPPSPIIGLLQAGNIATRQTLSDLFPSNGTILPPVAPPEAVPPPRPLPPAIKDKDTKPTPIGGKIQAAKLIQDVKPVYPRLAQQIRVQGVVVLEAVIARDGSVKSLRVISGHPLLSQAAVDAVQEWLYRPTLLNGEPVEVVTAITVTFTLR